MPTLKCKVSANSIKKYSKTKVLLSHFSKVNNLYVALKLLLLHKTYTQYNKYNTS